MTSIIDGLSLSGLSVQFLPRQQGEHKPYPASLIGGTRLRVEILDALLCV